LVSISQLDLPQRFYKNLPPQSYSNQYPHGQYNVASLHVATQHRNVSLNDIDFVFGGSTLELLAQQDESMLYMVMRVPATENTLLVVNYKEYVKDFSDVGSQFERLVTGLEMNQQKSHFPFFVHMTTMLVGDKYNVLFCAEANALDGNDDPVEITTSYPRYWGTKTMFRMISNGCPTICYGNKERDELIGVDIIRLSSVANDALQSWNCKTLQNNIVNGMKAIREQMMDKEDGYVYRISFECNGMLKLVPTAILSSVVENILPSTKIVKELL
jgi:hypothetical protein